MPPTYDYVCLNKKCDHKFEEIQNINDDKLVKCPKCNEMTLVRLISGGNGVIFRGTGWTPKYYNK